MELEESTFLYVKFSLTCNSFIIHCLIYRCKEENCNAAFTTKQCLQFHYKKVHGFAEEVMPKIERSVEYTFAAYAGVKGMDTDILFTETNSKTESKMNNDLMCLEESTDVDDISK